MTCPGKVRFYTSKHWFLIDLTSDFSHSHHLFLYPGCMSLIQTTLQLSRKLLIIITPGASAEKSSDAPEAYDLTLGLHQALVQGETAVIVIQLGQMQDYTHLPLGLQHLLCKNSPLLWRDGESSPNSRFWKRVRYRMPAASSYQRSRVKSRSRHGLLVWCKRCISGPDSREASDRS